MKNASTLNTKAIPVSENLPDIDQMKDVIGHTKPYEQVKMPIRLLTTELLKTRDKTSLQELLEGKFREALNYIDFEILLQNKNKTGLELFMCCDSTEEPAANGAKRIRVRKKPNIKELFNLPVLCGPATVFQFDQPHLDNDLTAYLKMRKPSNCDHYLVLNLNNTFDIFGLLIFYFDQNLISGELIESADKLTVQFANALSHIIANEKRISDEKEKILLTAICEEIGMAKDKNDLLKAFNIRLKSLLKFNNSVIGTIDWINKTYSPFLTDLENPSENEPSFNRLKAEGYSIKDPIMEKVLRSAQPVVFKFEEIVIQPGMPDCIHESYECGRKEMVVIQLKRNENIVGFASVAYDEVGTFTDKTIEVFQFLSPILSTAMSNILLKEQIDRESFQKSVLSALQRDMAAIRNKEDLLKVINTQLKKLIYFTHNNMGIVSGDGKTYKGFLLDPNSTARESKFYSELVATANNVNDCICDQAIKSMKPLVIPMDKFMDKNPPLWFKVNYETGTQEIAITILPGEDRAKYLFLLFSDKKNNFNNESLEIIEQISCHLATAVANIKANEDIIEREKEKSILLSLSHDMAALRNKQDLLNIIQTKLTDYFDVDCFHISVINQDKQSHSVFLMTRRGKAFLPEDLDRISKKEYQIKEDEILERVTLSDSPVLFSLNRLNKYPLVPEYIRFYMDNSIDQLIGLRLKVGNKTIGCAWLQTASDISLPLLKGVCAQLSVAIFNILANEQIVAQLEEINAFKSRLQQENSYLIEHIHTTNNYKEIIGKSQCMRNVYNHIAQVAKSSSTVLLMGETGTGKELIASAIHMKSSYSDKLMVKVNCAAMPANLIESELFGHERGSFTGATERRIGKFELANNGTLFLDEIGEMPPELQVKLLRAIQEREIERVGGRQTIKVNVRIIAATNRELEKEIDAGHFRSDLYYRLNVYPINLPPLRERKEDILDLATAFLERYSRNNGKDITSISLKVQQELLNYHWPGNIRELEHLIERSVLMTNGPSLTEIFLPKKDFHKKNAGDEFSFKTIEENERDHIIKTLRKCDGKLSGNGGAAEFLGVPVSTLSSKLVKLGITKEQIFQK
jgi:formate hydrogenlyase transcriptional activator